MRRLKSFIYSAIARLAARLCILLANPKWGWKVCPNCFLAFVDLDVPGGYPEHVTECAHTDELVAAILKRAGPRPRAFDA